MSHIHSTYFAHLITALFGNGNKEPFYLVPTCRIGLDNVLATVTKRLRYQRFSCG